MKLYPNILVRALATFLRPLVVECIAQGAHAEGIQTYVGRRCARGEVRPTVVDKLRFPELGLLSPDEVELAAQLEREKHPQARPTPDAGNAR